MAVSDPFAFDAELWEWQGPAAWCFVSLPEELTDEIDDRFSHRAAGFGSIRVEVTVGAYHLAHVGLSRREARDADPPREERRAQERRH